MKKLLAFFIGLCFCAQAGVQTTIDFLGMVNNLVAQNPAGVAELANNDLSAVCSQRSPESVASEAETVGEGDAPRPGGIFAELQAAQRAGLSPVAREAEQAEEEAAEPGPGGLLAELQARGRSGLTHVEPTVERAGAREEEAFLEDFRKASSSPIAALQLQDKLRGLVQGEADLRLDQLSDEFKDELKNIASGVYAKTKDLIKLHDTAEKEGITELLKDIGLRELLEREDVAGFREAEEQKKQEAYAQSLAQWQAASATLNADQARKREIEAALVRASQASATEDSQIKGLRENLEKYRKDVKRQDEEEEDSQKGIENAAPMLLKRVLKNVLVDEDILPTQQFYDFVVAKAEEWNEANKAKPRFEALDTAQFTQRRKARVKGDEKAAAEETEINEKLKQTQGQGVQVADLEAELAELDSRIPAQVANVERLAQAKETAASMLAVRPIEEIEAKPLVADQPQSTGFEGEAADNLLAQAIAKEEAAEGESSSDWEDDPEDYTPVPVQSVETIPEPTSALTVADPVQEPEVSGPTLEEIRERQAQAPQFTIPLPQRPPGYDDSDDEDDDWGDDDD